MGVRHGLLIRNLNHNGSGQTVNKMDTTLDVPQATLTYGESLCGVNFNPSKDANVDRAKKLCAELADLTREHWCRHAYSEKSSLENQIYNHAMGEILNAQMTVEKLLTFKY